MSKAAAVSPDLKRRLYYNMLLTRKTEERIMVEYPKREMRCPTHLCIGHEAVAAGVCAALRTDDLLFAYYRSHGWYLSKGGDLNAMFSELMGKENGCAHGWGGSMHLIDLKAGVMGISAIVGGTISHAAGAALTMKIRKKDSVAVTAFGDGAVEEGVFHETMNFASLNKLPMLFVCENNLYATNTHLRERQANPEIYRHAERFNMAGVRVDGNDALAVHREASKAVARARKGGGPTLIECLTYRVFEHCGMNEDHALGYRTKKEIEQWAKKGPLVKAKNLVKPAEAEKMAKEIAGKLDAALEHARSSPFPTSLNHKKNGATR